MSYSKGQERFTVTDYFYNHEEMDIRITYGHSHAESSLQASTSAAATEAAITANASGASPNYRPVEKGQQGVLKLHESMVN